MEASTAAVLAVQLAALAAVVTALLLRLLCRSRERPAGGAGRAVLVTAADTALGLQLALHLADRGFRVLAGLREPEGSGPAARAVRAWQKEREQRGELQPQQPELEQPEAGGWLRALRLDAAREDQLREAAEATRGHLPAGEHGLWAVLCTAGAAARGRLDDQPAAEWEALLRLNAVGSLRAARALLPLLRPTAGRLVVVGAAAGAPGPGQTAHAAARHAVQGLAEGLRADLAAAGDCVRVLALRPAPALADRLFQPARFTSGRGENADFRDVDYSLSVLPMNALQTVEAALLARHPQESYVLAPQPRPTYFHRAFSGAFARITRKKSKHTTQNV